MTHQKKAEAYVREALPELMEPKAGCRLICKGDAWHEHGIMIRGDKLSNLTTGKIEERDDSWEILGHPIQLHHWLQVLGVTYLVNGAGQLRKQVAFNPNNHESVVQRYCNVIFNLTTGNPASEKDYESLCKIFGI